MKKRMHNFVFFYISAGSKIHTHIFSTEKCCDTDWEAAVSMQGELLRADSIGAVESDAAEATEQTQQRRHIITTLHASLAGRRSNGARRFTRRALPGEKRSFLLVVYTLPLSCTFPSKH